MEIVWREKQRTALQRLIYSNGFPFSDSVPNQLFVGLPDFKFSLLGPSFPSPPPPPPPYNYTLLFPSSNLISI